MADSKDLSKTEVGHLVFRHAQRPFATCAYSILPNDEFDIGREHVRDTWQINELTVSTHHLRFRCVMYDEDEDSKVYVHPMIYVRVLSSNCVRLVRTMSTEPGGEIIVRADGDVLLNHGDLLQLTPDISLLLQAKGVFHSEGEDLNGIQKKEIRCFSDQFLVSSRALGSGGQASVFLAIKQRSGRQMACKVVRKPQKRYDLITGIQQDLQLSEAQREVKLKKLERDLIHQRESLPREYNNLKDLDHPNIISLEKVICATYNVYIFQELITGGDLLSYMELKGALSEAQSAVIARQLLKAVNYLHDNGVVHRDIKPENVLLTSWRDGARIVLTDFGQSRTLDDAKTAAQKRAAFRMHSVVGTHGYTAPEVYRQVKRDLQQEGYSKAVDIWSIGCITAALLTGGLIFIDDDDEHKTCYKELPDDAFVQRWDLSIMDEGRAWADIGRKAKDFVKQCLILDDTKRLTAKQALLHHWFTNRHYAAEIEAAYQRAISDWTPREPNNNLIEVIDTTDVVLASTEPDHAKKYADEVKSRHFETAIPPMPPYSAFSHAQNAQAWPRHARTPIPAIHEDAEVRVPESPTATQFASISATAAPSQPAKDAAKRTPRRLSIEDFAPPQTQLPVVRPSPYALEESNSILTQSQPMLDGLPACKFATSLRKGVVNDNSEDAAGFDGFANRYS